MYRCCFMSVITCDYPLPWDFLDILLLYLSMLLLCFLYFLCFYAVCIACIYLYNMVICVTCIYLCQPVPVVIF